MREFTGNENGVSPIKLLSAPVPQVYKCFMPLQGKMLDNARKILVINLKYIGDTLWMCPFIRNLKLNLPDAIITALVNKGGEAFLELMPELSGVIVLDRKEMKGRRNISNFMRFLMKVRREKFDTVFVLSNSDRATIISFVSGARTRIGFRSDSWWRPLLLTERFSWDRTIAEKNPHVIDYNLRALTDAGLKIFDAGLTIDVPEVAIEAISQRFDAVKIRDRKAIIVHPGARVELRQWGSERFAEVINAVSEDYRVFLVGGPGDERVIEDVLKRLERKPDIVSNSLSLLEFAALCKFGDLFVGNDSAPIHIAAAVGTFVIGIYGPNLSKYCAPWTRRKALFDFSSLPCRPCRQDRCTHEEERACLKEVTPSMVIKKIREILSAY